MNRKIRVPLLLLLYSSVCPCFLPVKNCIKMHSNLSFWGQKIIFFWGSVSTTPHPSTPTAPRPLLTEIVNTPLLTLWHSDCESSPGSLDEHTTVSSDCQPSDQANKCRPRVHLMATIIYTHHSHLLLLLRLGAYIYIYIYIFTLLSHRGKMQS